MDANISRRRVGALAIVALVLFSVAGSLGVYAWYLWTSRAEAEQKLELAETSVQDLQQQRLETQKKMIGLEAERSRLARSEEKTKEIEAKLAATEARLQNLSEERAEIDARLAEFREVTEKFRSMIDSGTLEVTFRRGRMIVELPASVLFDSGSAELSDEGKKAVAEVAAILRNVPRRRFMVGGHTDNVPAVKEYKSNWTLSTARAVTVLEALIRSRLAPQRLVAAGYAEFDPVASNATESGRQRNRRIEIILEPHLTELPGAAQEKEQAEARSKRP